MNIGIIGLGLIGGSMAKAMKTCTDNHVMGWDISSDVMYKAKLINAVDDFLPDGNPLDCDMVIVALYPADTVEYIKKHAANFKKGSVVIDCCGIKTYICKSLMETNKNHDFTFIGGHPMAGIERSGLTFSSAKIFKNATMLLTPYKGTDLNLLNNISFLFKSLGFDHIQITTWEEHDRMIAYTSQLAHVVSSAYIKNDLSYKYKGFSAGSFHDMTRIAKLNEDMWTQLFMDNRENLIEELDGIIERLTAYSKAIKDNNETKLKKLLKEGREKRQSIEDTPEFN